MAKPTYMSEFPDGTDVTTLGVGAAMMGMGTYDHQQQLAGVLEAQAPDGRHLFRRVVVQQPRRSAKTTTIWATLIGRCLTYPGYTVVTTAQDGTRAGDKIREVMEVLETFGFEEYGHGKLYWSNGKERIRFDNGSVISVVAPKPGTFRSKAADCILFDEAGELDTELGSALLAGALPLMDTRVNPQIIIAGTPGEQRAGLLWDALEDGRANKPRIGIVDYCATDDDQTTLIDEASDTVILNTELVERVHPGIGTLTTLEVIQERFEDMTLALFEREYLGKWPVDAFSAAIDPALWLKAMVSPEERPDRVGIAFDVHKDGTSATLAYAWRVDGVAYVELVHHDLGVNWLPKMAYDASRKYRRQQIAYDKIGANLDPGQQLSKMKPAPRTQWLAMNETVAAAQRFVQLLRDGRLRHFGQGDLDAAVMNTTWRVAGTGRVFGPKVPKGAPINPLVAASLALWSYDQGHDRAKLTIAV